MTVQSILLPVFVYVAMVFVVTFAMGRARVGALKRGEAKIRDIAVEPGGFPVEVRQIGNSYDNQFQLPMLFLVLVVLALVTKKADLLFVVLEWLFVASRIIHAWIHCTSNFVPWRFRAFVAGLFVLIAMWAIFAVRVLTAG